MNEDFIDNVLREMLKKIATESIRIRDLAETKSYDIICKALKLQRGYK